MPKSRPGRELLNSWYYVRFFSASGVFFGELQPRRSPHEVYSWGNRRRRDRRRGFRAAGRGSLLLERLRDGPRGPKLPAVGRGLSHVSSGPRPAAFLSRLVLTPGRGRAPPNAPAPPFL